MSLDSAAQHVDSDHPAADALEDFCIDLFEVLPRCDQRRWATTYIRGLVTLDGRKTISRISESILGRPAEQNLQQFVNQSPWDWSDVRRRLAETAATEIHTRAWVVGEVALPKSGSHSVGVDRQFSHTEQRTMNCQLAMAAFLDGGGTGVHESVPVDWRLMLPRSWHDDPIRRRRTHVPEDETTRTRAAHMLSMVDELSSSWALPRVPVVYDSRQDNDIAEAIDGLEARGHHYLVRLPENATLSTLPDVSGAVGLVDYVRRAARLSEGLRQHPSPAYAARVPGHGSSSGDNAEAPRDELRNGVHAPRTHRAIPTFAGARPAVVTVPAPPPRPIPGAALHSHQARHRHLAATWYPRQTLPRSVWLTNLPVPWLGLVPELMASALRLGKQVHRLETESGLTDFEGRSYRGWHHHTTLASAAHGFRVLERVATPPVSW